MNVDLSETQQVGKQYFRFDLFAVEDRLDVIEDGRENRANLGNFRARCAAQHLIVGDVFDRLAQVFDLIAKQLKLRHVVREKVFRFEFSHDFEEIVFGERVEHGVSKQCLSADALELLQYFVFENFGGGRDSSLLPSKPTL